MMNYINFVAQHEKADEVPAEYFFERIRNWRNAELIACDWTQVADSTVDKTTWATYRQALRDLPSQNSDPKKIVFPARPE
jgi:hypothetical protein